MVQYIYIKIYYIYIYIMNSSFILPSVTTGIKIFGTTCAAIATKSIQAFDSVSDANIGKVFSDASTRINTEVKSITKQCSGEEFSMENIKEEKIIQKLICKIISNKDKGVNPLSNESLKTLSSIINIYSKKTYVSMPKEVYENEKNAASDAIQNGIIGTQLVNTGVDIGVAAVKSSIPSNSFVKDYLTPPPPQSQSPLNSATSVLGKALVPAAATLATFYIGKKIFQKFNTVIPKKYIPDFNLLVTALTDRQKMKNKLIEESKTCNGEIMEEFYKKINDYFTANPFSNDLRFTYNPQSDPVNIRRTEFNFEKKELKRGNYAAPGLLKNEAIEQCKSVYKAQVAVIDSDIQNIQGITKEFTSLFTKTTGSDLTELKEATKELVPILSNIELKNISISELRETITSKITEFRQQQTQKPQNKPVIDRMTNWLLPPGGGGRTVNRRKEKRRKTTRRR